MLCNDLKLIENHAYAQLSKVYVLDHTIYAKHEATVCTILAAYYPMLQIEVSCTRPPSNDNIKFITHYRFKIYNLQFVIQFQNPLAPDQDCRPCPL